MHGRTPTYVALALLAGLAAGGGARSRAPVRSEVPAESRPTSLEPTGETSSAPDGERALAPELAAWLARLAASVAALGPGHPWAGEYLVTDGFESTTLWLAPEGWACVGSGCFGVELEAHGSVRLADGALRLEPAWSDPPDPDPPLPREVLAVPWGARVFLVPTERVLAFAEESRAGRPAFPSRLRRADEPRAGRPELPERFAHALDAPPVAGRVSAVLAARESGTVGPIERHRIARARARGEPVDVPLEHDVRVEGGAARGFFRGMRVRVLEPEGAALEGRVLAVDAGTAAVRLWSRAARDGAPSPAPGWRVGLAPGFR